MYLVLNLATGLVSPQYHCLFDDFFITTLHNKPNIVTSSTWKQLAGIRQADGTLAAQEPLKSFAEPSRVLEEHHKPAQNYPEALENSDDFSSIGEFPHEIGTCNDSNNSENLTEDPLQDSEGASPTNSTLPSASTSSHGRQHNLSKTMAELVSQ